MINGFKKSNKRFFFPSDFPIERRVQSHLKYNKENALVVGFLDKMIDLAKKKNHNLMVVIPPVNSAYLNQLNSIASLQVCFKVLEERGVSVQNFMGNPVFLDKYFGDYDHLYPEGDGVRVLTETLKSIIYFKKSAADCE